MFAQKPPGANKKPIFFISFVWAQHRRLLSLQQFHMEENSKNHILWINLIFL